MQNFSSIVLLSLFASSFAWETFTVPHVDGEDDTPGLLSVMANFSSDATILFEKGVTYNIFTPIKFPVLENVEVTIEGNLTYPSDIATIQAIVGESSFPGSWFTFSGGSNVTLRGSTDPEWGWVDAHGQAWWDANQQTNRPHGWAFSKINGGVIRDMKLWKPIGWNFATSGANNVHIFNNKIVAVSSTGSFPFNTDGFSAGGSNLLFEANSVQNGDDCLTVGNGAVNITFRNSYCEGGHGLSIGSLGENGQVANVQNVWIENVIMNNTLYAARFKSWTGGNGFAKNITWKDIAFSNVPFPIYVTQNYWDQEDGPRPNSSSTNNTHVEDVLFQNFVGTIEDKPFIEGSCVTDPCWYAVPGATGKEVIIFDLYPGTATNIVAKDIFSATETGARVAVMCNSTAISGDVGFVCQDGPYIPTLKGLL
ncbi:pectin lyase-like protein [Schizopora paradoxa]|uniref:galacturonan 1,4-alpha-galacturonidase n=1 Tax=Schizopora paradoxa TaxID=27342 RepID=A0A0H2S798_9AGAM|nr:pectin lyase-like protein [Schizopora paradoxa]